MKDYYDIYYLANKFDFKGNLLTEAIRKTFCNREHDFTIERFDQVVGFVDNDDMQRKWKAFVRKINIKTEDFGVVMETITGFLRAPFSAAIKKADFIYCWSASKRSWV